MLGHNEPAMMTPVKWLFVLNSCNPPFYQISMNFAIFQAILMGSICHIVFRLKTFIR